MKEDQKKEIIDNVAALNLKEQVTVIGVIRGMEIANTINESKKTEEKKLA